MIPLDQVIETLIDKLPEKTSTNWWPPEFKLILDDCLKINPGKSATELLASPFLLPCATKLDENESSYNLWKFLQIKYDSGEKMFIKDKKSIHLNYENIFSLPKFVKYLFNKE
ncbi:hypothetical protein MXB_3104 [Myxobolus squamalis]|nr:hypothetical protein MXB_3104 [Myxobolus squamalis]